LKTASYFNELAGGPENGWKHLLGSNFDWGQSIPLLAASVPDKGGRSVSHAIPVIGQVLVPPEVFDRRFTPEPVLEAMVTILRAGSRPAILVVRLEWALRHYGSVRRLLDETRVCLRSKTVCVASRRVEGWIIVTVFERGAKP